MNIPNLLTLLRIILSPIIVILLIQGALCTALIAFAIAGLTDALDGYLSRALNQQTLLGAYLDPIADKALVASTFITLSVLNIIPGWLTVIVISRDFLILLGIAVLSLMSVSVKIRPLFVSRVTTTLQLITVLAALLARCLQVRVEGPWLMAVYGATALLTVVSGIGYLSIGVDLINHTGKK